MDSITQASLGAAISEVVLERKVGNKAIIWGAVAGTMPDLDILAYPLMDQLDQLAWHRGPSHAFFYLTLAAPFLGWIISKFHKRAAKWKDWTLMIYLTFITHVILDTFNVYGTQLFRPFSHWPVAFDTISIIDLLYTLPLIIPVIIALFLKRTSSLRRYIVIAGIALSTFYLALTVAFKQNVNSVSLRNFERQNIITERFITTPTIFNTILWRVTAEVDDGFYVGYYSLLDSDEEIDFAFIPQNDSLLVPFEHTEAVERLRWFSRGFYVVSKHNNGIHLADIRFGSLDAGKPGSRRFIFEWLLEETPDRPGRGEIYQLQFKDVEFDQLLYNLWLRLIGTKR